MARVAAADNQTTRRHRGMSDAHISAGSTGTIVVAPLCLPRGQQATGEGADSSAQDIGRLGVATRTSSSTCPGQSPRASVCRLACPPGYTCRSERTSQRSCRHCQPPPNKRDNIARNLHARVAVIDESLQTLSAFGVPYSAVGSISLDAVADWHSLTIGHRSCTIQYKSRHG